MVGVGVIFNVSVDYWSKCRRSNVVHSPRQVRGDRSNFQIVRLPDGPAQSAFSDIQGGPEKNGNAYFPQYVDAITIVSFG